MNARLKTFVSIAALSATLGAAGCVVHDRPGYYGGRYGGGGYHRPGVVVQHQYRTYDNRYDNHRYESRDRDRYDHDRYDGQRRYNNDDRRDNCWYENGRRYCRR